MCFSFFKTKKWDILAPYTKKYILAKLQFVNVCLLLLCSNYSTTYHHYPVKKQNVFQPLFQCLYYYKYDEKTCYLEEWKKKQKQSKMKPKSIKKMAHTDTHHNITSSKT